MAQKLAGSQGILSAFRIFSLNSVCFIVCICSNNVPFEFCKHFNLVLSQFSHTMFNVCYLTILDNMSKCSILFEWVYFTSKAKDLLLLNGNRDSNSPLAQRITFLFQVPFHIYFVYYRYIILTNKYFFSDHSLEDVWGVYSRFFFSTCDFKFFQYALYFSVPIFSSGLLFLGHKKF